MFRKLVTNLPYSPGLLNQMSFYVGRLKKEEFSRRIGLIFICLALTVQTLVIFAPPKPSLASSTNDIIYGGGDKTKIINAYNNNRDDLGRTDIKAIFERFGITGDSLLRAIPGDTIQSYEGNGFRSIGRHPKFSSTIEQRVDIPGHNPVYIRPLHAWDSGTHSTYETLHGQTDAGLEYWILYDCGNIVIRDEIPPEEVEQSAELQINKSIITPSGTADPGGIIEYSIKYRNIGPNNAAFMEVNDVVPSNTEYVSFEAKSPHVITEFKDGTIKLYHDNAFAALPPSDSWHEAILKVRIKETVTDGTRICNTATIKAVEGVPGDSDEVCITVEVEEQQSFNCVSLAWEFKDDSRTAGTFTIRGNAENTSIKSFKIHTGEEQQILTVDASNNQATLMHEYPDTEKTYRATAQAVDSEGSHSIVGNCYVQIQITDEPTPIITHDKRASNLTDGVENANNVLASAGDEIEYTLSTTNSGTGPAVDFVLPVEDIKDILEYADLIDQGDAKFDEETSILSWDPVTIDVDQTIEKKFKVKVKDPIPETPVSASDGDSFNLVMSNRYEDKEVNIPLEPPIPKQVEEFTRPLPNTGPGANIAISTILFGGVTYFYSRNRLLSKELKMIKQDYSGGAGDGGAD